MPKRKNSINSLLNSAFGCKPTGNTGRDYHINIRFFIIQPIYRITHMVHILYYSPMLIEGIHRYNMGHESYRAAVLSTIKYIYL